MRTKAYIVAGEVSGDNHGAGLMSELINTCKDIEFYGMGGPSMINYSDRVQNWINESAVVGFWEVIKKYRYFKKVFDEVVQEIENLKPEVVILVDYPGFNLRLAESIRQRGIDTKIVYYISPQVWAWKRGRVKRMAKTIDLMLCLFPFEVSFYEGSSLDAKFVGHPISETLGSLRSQNQRNTNLVALLPGSREREVEKIFPVMLDAAKQVLKFEPNVHFEASAASKKCEEKMKTMALEKEVPCKVSFGNANELMSKASCGAVASGTATLEAPFLGLPYCLVYKVSTPTYFLAKGLIAVNFLGMANLLAERELVREFIQYDANPEKISSELLRLIVSDEERCCLSENLKEVTQPLAQAGAYATAAKSLINAIELQ